MRLVMVKYADGGRENVIAGRAIVSTTVEGLPRRAFVITSDVRGIGDALSPGVHAGVAEAGRRVTRSAVQVPYDLTDPSPNFARALLVHRPLSSERMNGLVPYLVWGLWARFQSFTSFKNERLECTEPPTHMFLDLLQHQL